MFTMFGRFHRHKNLENAIIELAEELTTLKLKYASLQAKSAVEVREKKKIDRVNAVKSLPQDVRDILAHYPGGEVESVLDSDGHAVFIKGVDNE